MRSMYAPPHFLLAQPDPFRLFPDTAIIACGRYRLENRSGISFRHSIHAAIGRRERAEK